MSLMQSPTMINIKADTLRFGLAMIVSQLFLTKSFGSLNDSSFMKETLLVLLGFATYQLTVAKLINVGDYATGRVKDALADVVKVGTMLIAAQLLGGGSLSDEDWMKNSSALLIGFTAFNLVVGNVVDGSSVSDPKMRMIANDAARFGTVFTVQQWLMGKSLNANWFRSSAGYIGGLALYDYFLM